MDLSLNIPRYTDKALLGWFSELTKKHAPVNLSISWVGGKNSNDVEKSLQEAPASTYSVIRIRADYNGLSVTLTRPNWSGEKDSPIHDKIAFTNNSLNSGTFLNADEKLEIANFITGKIGGNGALRLSPEGAERFREGLEHQHSVILERLENAAVSQLEANQKHAQKIDEIHAEQRKTLEDEHSNKLKVLAEEKKELERLRAELNDRENTHERRAIRDAINNRIDDRLKNIQFSEGTKLASKKVLSSYIIFLLIIFAANVYFAYQVSNTYVLGVSTSQWIVAHIKSALSALVFIGFATYFMRWLTREYTELANSETAIRNYQLDMERSSWIVEMALEWRKEQSNDIPEPLIRGLTHGLFQDDKKCSHDDDSAADSLASAILGKSARVRLNTGAADIEFDSKGIKSLEKTSLKDKM